MPTIHTTTQRTGKKESVICFPRDMADNRYTGILQGYHIENTAYFNILPRDGAATETFDVGVIGYVFASRPFPSTDRIRFCLGSSAGGFRPVDLKAIKAARQTEAEEVPVHAALGLENSRIGDRDLGEYLVIGYWEDDNLHFIDLTAFSGGKLDECKQEPYSLRLDVFFRNTGILESDIMLDKGAMFIGCGSVGSLFALELARAGVGRFLLIDRDIFGYHNICRHQCGIMDVGKYKTEALKERILRINPYAEVVVQNCFIQDVPIGVLKDFCDTNTIVVGGADNREGDLYANGIAKQVGMPFMSIGCWERAFAGEIFYCLPEGMPDYEDFVKVTGTMSGRVNQNRQFYTTEEDLEKTSFEPGISVDINFVTTVAVKLAIDLLNRDNERYTPPVIGSLTQYTLVCNTNNPDLGGEMAEIFSYPLQVTRSIYVPYSENQES